VWIEKTEGTAQQCDIKGDQPRAPANAVGDFDDADEGFAERQCSKSMNRVGKVRTEATK
jgi:hypothetical protein